MANMEIDLIKTKNWQQMMHLWCMIMLHDSISLVKLVFFASVACYV